MYLSRICPVDMAFLTCLETYGIEQINIERTKAKNSDYNLPTSVSRDQRKLFVMITKKKDYSNDLMIRCLYKKIFTK